MNAIFCQRLKELRNATHLGQVDLSKKLGVSKSNIGAWEKGINEPVLTNLIRMADFFDVTLDYLCGRTDY